MPLRMTIYHHFSGGWAGGSASSEDFIKNSDLMWKQSVWSSTISARLASKHLKEGGMVYKRETTKLIILYEYQRAISSN